ncbi:hypothetical protein CDAR_590821 [Caerostris darwini]|uniref:Uncharacterized protein n=1 Tax=Caerostris darwini TaxID=1538125 RepID=A0AAV4TQE3_9ARAC|nr:hypothetical protein CDAR_590821 [Caerostris darwini]
MFARAAQVHGASAWGCDRFWAGVAAQHRSSPDGWLRPVRSLVTELLHWTNKMLLRKRDSFHLANAEGEIEVLECNFDSSAIEESAVKVTVL